MHSSSAFQCPVCGNPNVSDFRITTAVCPVCDNDLNAYRLLHQLKNVGNRKTATILAGIGGLALGALFVWGLATVRQDRAAIASVTPAAAIDSVAFYRQQIALLNDSLSRKASPAGNRRFTYTVRRGDNLWAIADKFYSSGCAWATIRDANNLPEGAVLRTGQSLIIPVNE